jgi:protein TonB
MFHYRLTPLNSRTRMLIAVFLATVIHLGIMKFEFNMQPVLVPSVSLPRSVSVFLGQGKVVETPDQQKKEEQAAERVFEEQPEAKPEPEKPVLQKITPVKGKKRSPVQQPMLPQKTVTPPFVEKVMAVPQGLENSKKDLAPEPGEAGEIQKSTGSAEPLAVQNEGVSLPGTLQLAYPRYHMNTPPVYPGRARKRGQEGTVFLQVLVDKEGRVDELKIETSSGFSLLDRAALTAVKKWSFEPGRQGKKIIPMWVRVPVTFKLKK